MDDVTCDGCDKPFSPRLVEVHEKGGVRQSFACPDCGRRYEVAFITTTGVKLRKELKVARRRGQKDLAGRLLERYQAEVTRPSATRR